MRHAFAIQCPPPLLTYGVVLPTAGGATFDGHVTLWTPIKRGVTKNRPEPEGWVDELQKT